MAHVAGMICSGVYPNPVPYHSPGLQLTHKTLAGPHGGLILAKGGDEEFLRN